MISGIEVSAALERACHRLLEMRDQLNELDAAMGDGDSGLTAEKGAMGVLEYLASSPIPVDLEGFDLGLWLIGAGQAYNRAAPSTMGALVATALMRAGKEARGLSSLDDATLARMLIAASLGVQERGKSKPGDKTVVDALDPAAKAFEAALAGGASLELAGTAMLTSARAGRDDARGLRSRVGRAGWVGERTEGQFDPGTVWFVATLEAVLGVPSDRATERAS